MRDFDSTAEVAVNKCKKDNLEAAAAKIYSEIALSTLIAKQTENIQKQEFELSKFLPGIFLAPDLSGSVSKGTERSSKQANPDNSKGVPLNEANRQDSSKRKDKGENQILIGSRRESNEHGSEEQGLRANQNTDSSSFIDPRAEITEAELNAILEALQSNEDMLDTWINFSPFDGAYNPVGPPGLGEIQAIFANEDPQFPPFRPSIDFRRPAIGNYSPEELARFRRDEGLRSNLRQTGRLSPSFRRDIQIGQLQNDDPFGSDTDFRSEEVWSSYYGPPSWEWRYGALIERHIRYDSPTDIKFQGPDRSIIQVEDVVSVDSRFNPQSGRYNTIITKANGETVSADTDMEGKVMRFGSELASGRRPNLGINDQFDVDMSGSLFGTQRLEDIAGSLRSVETSPENFRSVGGRINPAGPPGLGDFTPGRRIEDDEPFEGAAGQLDFRHVQSYLRTSDDGATHFYEGQIRTNQGLGFQDVSFTGSESVDENGKIIERHIRYQDPIDFVSSSGYRLEGVVSVDVLYSPERSAYVSRIRLDDERILEFLSSPSGEHLSGPRFVDSGWQEDESPDPVTGRFQASPGLVHPLKPLGIGMIVEAGNLASGDGGIDWREARRVYNDDGSSTVRVRGELSDFDEFETTEEVDNQGRLVSSRTTYDSPVTLSFMGPADQAGNPSPITIEEIKTVISNRGQDGNYITSIFDEDGQNLGTLVTNASGRVIRMIPPAGRELEQAPGERWSRWGSAGNRSSDDNHHPLRPPGFEFFPGEAGQDDDRGIDWRYTTTHFNGDGSTTYSYRGELNDGGLGGDTNFMGWEQLDTNGDPIAFHIEYDDEIDVTLLAGSSQGRSYYVLVEGVRSVDSRRQADGSYITVVNTVNGAHIFYTDARGNTFRGEHPRGTR